MSAIQPAAKPPFWRDVKTLAWLFQIAVLGLVVLIIAVLYNNVRVNSSNQGIPVGFDFLDQPAGFPIPANDFRTSQPVRDAITEGVLNTLRVVVVGIILTTILGIAIGIGRLSGNWLIRNTARVYVEAIRNVPLPALLVFIYLAVVLVIPPRVEESWIIDGLFVGNNRGFTLPWLDGSGLAALVVLAAAVAVALAIRRWRLAVFDRTGEPTQLWLYATLPVLATLAIGGLVAGLGVTSPELDGRLTIGGMTMQPEYFALLAALVIYTSSHVAEIVRGSIQAVPKGQVEASMAMALGGWQRMRFVILPQAMRIALPPLGNQYLNLLKNSSLGLVVSYFDVTKVVQTSIGNRSPAVPAYLLLMVLYLIASLVISAGVNMLNRRLAVS